MDFFSWIKPENPISFPPLGLELGDIPRGFSIGPLNIQFYGVIITVGLLLAIIYGIKRSKQFGITEDNILDGVLGIVPFAIICARLYYCAFRWDVYSADPITILYIWKGGLAIYGGVIGAAIGVVVLCLVKKIKIGALLDLVALGFLLGQGIGRWGNFFNREAFGALTESFLGMEIISDITNAKGLYHPTFLYESLWNLSGFVILHFLSKRRRYDGQIALGYVFWYGLGRTFIEGLRLDSLMLGSFRVSQLLAAVSCFTAAVVLIVMAFRKHDPQKLFVNIKAARDAAAAEAAKAAEEAEESAEEAGEAVTEETEEPKEEEAEEPKEEEAEE